MRRNCSGFSRRWVNPLRGNPRHRRSFEMRNRSLGITLALAIILSCSAAASSQDKDPSKPAKTADSGETHDLTGVWMQDHPPATADQYWIYKFTVEGLPLKAWAQGQY